MIRSDRRTLCIEIRPGNEVILRVPREASDSEIERFVAEHEEWIRKKTEAMQNLPQPELSEEEAERLRQLAKQVIPQRVAYWESVMNLHPARIKITSAKHRFGSCSSDNGVCFSFRLMRHSLREIDYVIVHELAHIQYHNHSPAFYCLVKQYLPDYREREKALRMIGL